MRIALCIAVLTALGISPSVAADSDAMAKAANGFYGVYKTSHPADGVPDAGVRARYTPYISSGLSNALASADAVQAKFSQINKNAPPLLEGDLFTSNYDGATSVQVGACAGDDKAAHCTVNLAFVPNKNLPTGKPLNWTDTAYLVNENGSWRVDDIGYGGNWDYGNKGRMRDALKMVIQDAGN